MSEMSDETDETGMSEGEYQAITDDSPPYESTRNTVRKFIQILTSDTSLTALDNMGDVWVYLGQRFGWSKLNMIRLSARDAARVRKIKFGDNPQHNDEDYLRKQF